MQQTGQALLRLGGSPAASGNGDDPPARGVRRAPVEIAAVKDQIQLLAEEIAALRGIGVDDPRRAAADRVVAVKVGAIRTLRRLLPGIPVGDGDVRRQQGYGADAAAAPIPADGSGCCAVVV